MRPGSPAFFFLVSFVAALLAFRVRADDAPSATPDLLVYHDGDRVHGRLLRIEDDRFVFQSPRFGELRVPLSDASVATADPNPPPLPGPAETREPASSSDSPLGLARALRSFFGPWSGRFLTSVQMARDVGERTDFMVETALERTWTQDEVQLTGRYDLNRNDDGNRSDIFRAGGLWRHTLPRRLFSVYRPLYEWHRGASGSSVNHNYILLQQELGLGITWVDRETWKLRTGVAENFFHNWDLRGDDSHSARVESVFLETNVRLPWRIAITERAVYYYSFQTGGDGWEHQFEVAKKLTDTLSLGLRHEARYNAPDVRSTDYSLLRLFLGLDF